MTVVLCRHGAGRTFSVEFQYHLFVESKVWCLYHRGNRRCRAEAV